MNIEAIAVSTDHLAGVEADVDLCFRNVTDILEVMEADLTHLEQDWTGQASLNYQQRMLEWRRGLADMAGTLNTIALTIATGNSDYTTTENTIVNGW
ncbi:MULTISPECIES: WXG100 family type VII secretion target [unclassified Pseudactinotalea]|uniref:WXG100 family type VII secretion target n=1 Tax=unclassified Pseudactinotalea TaxID=2649176 RepID=UPI00128D0876|nr:MULTISPECIES: WXG100 family type VII secretion target [unclassified Pseudactinotalea]MPV49049.1 WXG100 family type VII secretion target [Pseudactinotalea sp. HY160]QGH68273.1 WXG100 family type VII secretion target [Pseudactinotalea sp. HY158]